MPPSLHIGRSPSGTQWHCCSHAFTLVWLTFSFRLSCARFVTDAIDFVATHGWKFVSDYMFWTDTGEWRHRSVGQKAPHRRWLGAISYATGRMEYTPHKIECPAPSVTDVFAEAARAGDAALVAMQKAKAGVDERRILDPQIEALGLLWFVLPSDVKADVRAGYVGGDGSADLEQNRATTVRQGTVAFLPQFSDGEAAVEPIPASEPSAGLLLSDMPDVPPVSEEVSPEQVAAVIAAVCTTGHCSLGAVLKGSCMDDAMDGVVSVVEDDPLAADYVVDKGDTDAHDDDDAASASPRGVKRSGALADEGPERGGMVLTEHAPSVDTGSNGKRLKTAHIGLQTRVKVDRKLWPKIPKNLMNKTGKAIMDYGMIAEGDRVLLGLSGGKDSLCMLHVLHEFQQKAPINFELACVTMDPQFDGLVHPSP
jgi:hypothetical protein